MKFVNVYLLPKFVWGLSMFTCGLDLCTVCQCFHVAWIYLGFINVHLWPGFDSGLDLSMLTCGLDLSVVWICQCLPVVWIYLGFVNVYLWPGFDRLGTECVGFVSLFHRDTQTD